MIVNEYESQKGSSWKWIDCSFHPTKKCDQIRRMRN